MILSLGTPSAASMATRFRFDAAGAHALRAARRHRRFGVPSV